MNHPLGYKTNNYQPYRPEMSLLERYSGFKDFKALEKAVADEWLMRSAKPDYKLYFEIKMPDHYGVPKSTDVIDGWGEGGEEFFVEKEFGDTLNGANTQELMDEY